MKRINPDTGKEFKYRDKRPKFEKQDNRIFRGYKKNQLDKNGFFYEDWAAKTSILKEFKRRSSSRKKSRNSPLPKRLHPEGRPFKHGEHYEGKYFRDYGYNNNNSGFREEVWLDEEQFQRHKIRSNLLKVKKRAKNKKIQFELDIDYVESIFPLDMKCSLLGVKMAWGDDDLTISPSIDKIIPKKGYVKGNVQWVSHKANSMKSNASPEELIRFALSILKSKSVVNKITMNDIEDFNTNLLGIDNGEFYKLPTGLLTHDNWIPRK